MYSIILNLLFFFVAVVMYLLRLPFTESQDAYLIFSIGMFVPLVAGTVSIFATSINQLVKAQEMLGVVEGVTTIKNKIVLRMAKKDDTMKYMEEQMLNVFPKFEERVLKSLSPNSNTDLIALFQQYPELKSSKHLSDLVNDYDEMVKSIYDEKESLEYKKGNIREYLRNPWFFYTIKLSKDLLTEINTPLI